MKNGRPAIRGYFSMWMLLLLLSSSSLSLGLPAIRGHYSVCGCKVFRIGKMKK